MRIPFQPDHDPDGLRLPIKIDTTSNGEFQPLPLQPEHYQAHRLALRQAADHARRRGQNRRRFLVSACGVATNLLALNQVYAAAGKRGGFFAVDAAAALDPELASRQIDGDEFIFDVQGHFVNPEGDWLKGLPDSARPLSGMPNAACGLASEDQPLSYLQCLGPERFIQDVFVDSDTDMMVLSFVPSHRDAEPLTIAEAAATREVVASLEGSHRLLLHGRVNPNQDGDMQGMDELAERWRISAWKTYTQWGPDGVGYYLSDDVGLAFIEKARQLGVKVICVHKGIPFGPRSYEHSLCDDIGVVARQFPDMSFIIYHSGFVPGQAEGPFDPQHNNGIDSLVKSLRDNEVAPHSNVYAELGSTWRFLMRDPDSAAHALGKLLLAVGENNVLWGTDSIWYGSPQDQIQAFRTFQIAPELSEAHGYPQLTAALKAKIFGLNATKPYRIEAAEVQRRMAGDAVQQLRLAHRDQPNPHYRTYGPRNRREFMRLRWLQGGDPR
ncbi:MAG: hypothetical protein Tsb002_32830 [Wenzhouxiangellaceae bacterium]